MVNPIRYFLIFLLFTQVFFEYPTAAIPACEPCGRNIIATKQRLFDATKKILILQGFVIRSVDERSGTLTTAISPMRLSSSDCECGVTTSPAEDVRPVINVSIDVKTDDNWILIQTRIFGDYPKDRISERIIENDLFDQISRYLD